MRVETCPIKKMKKLNATPSTENNGRLHKVIIPVDKSDQSCTESKGVTGRLE